MNIISRIVIENFRSIKKIDIKIGGINVFSGLNDVGKSNILKALNLFFNNQTDFHTPLIFNNDFSKIALASAQKARKQKQQIKIKIFLKPPNTFRSLGGFDEVYIERVFDRNGSLSEYYSPGLTKVQGSQLTRLIHKVQYFFIPALKGPDVLRHLLGEIGGHQLISQDEIANLNLTVNKKLGDLQKILGSSQISTKTSVGLPTLVKDFWEGLKINTEYDLFETLQQKTQVTKKGK